MKRILVLNYEFPPLGGGAANATYYLLKEYAKMQDITIDLVTSSVNSFKIEEFSDNVTIHYLDIGKSANMHYQSNKDLLMYSYKAYKYSKKLMNEGAKFDLCHAFFGIPCGYIAMKLGIPYIVSLRGSDVPFYNKRFYWLDTFVFKRLSIKIWIKAKAVIANSEELKKLAQQSAPRQTIGVIYNGVDTEEFKPGKKEPADKLRLISTGRLIKRKGYRYLIEAISGLKNVRLTLVGGGNLKPELESLAKEKDSDVVFLGPKDHKEIVSLLQQSDVFALPSLNEGMSNSILEAMAVGLPIITTNTGGTIELIKQNGIVVEQGSADSLKKAFEVYIKDPALVTKQASVSRELAEEMSWKNVAIKYKELYIIK